VSISVISLSLSLSLSLSPYAISNKHIVIEGISSCTEMATPSHRNVVSILYKTLLKMFALIKVILFEINYIQIKLLVQQGIDHLPLTHVL
jgi:hypothetical protein